MQMMDRGDAPQGGGGGSMMSCADIHRMAERAETPEELAHLAQMHRAMKCPDPLPATVTRRAEVNNHLRQRLRGR